MRGRRAEEGSKAAFGAAAATTSAGKHERPLRRRRQHGDSGSDAGADKSIVVPAAEALPATALVPTQSLLATLGSIPQYIPFVGWLLASPVAAAASEQGAPPPRAASEDTSADGGSDLPPPALPLPALPLPASTLVYFGTAGDAAGETLDTFERFMRFSKANKEELGGFSTKLMNPYVYFYAVHVLYNSEKFMKKASDDMRARLYGSRQQVARGPCTTAPPSCLLFSREEAARWQAWKNLGEGCSRAAAIRQFLRALKEVDPLFSSSLVPSSHAVQSKQLTLLQLIERDALERFSKLVTQRKLLRFVESLRLIQRHIVKVQTAARRFLARHRAIRMFNQRFTVSDTRALKVLLRAGIIVLKIPFNGGHPSQRRLWLDTPGDDVATSRLCIAHVAQVAAGAPGSGDSVKRKGLPGSVAAVAGMMSRLLKGPGKGKGKGASKSKGLYLADVAEVRQNASSFSFKLASLTLEEASNLPLSIVAAERTIDVLLTPTSLPQGKSREWFARSLSALADEALTDTELASRGYTRGSRAAIELASKTSSPGDAAAAAQMLKVLEKGFNVTVLTEAGEVVGRAVWFVPQTRRLSMGPRAGDADRGGAVRSLHVNDVSEVRPGRMSEAAPEGSGDADTMISVVGTENTLVFHVDKKQLRNLLCRRLQLFVAVNRDTTGSDL